MPNRPGRVRLELSSYGYEGALPARCRTRRWPPNAVGDRPSQGQSPGGVANPASSPVATSAGYLSKSTIEEGFMKQLNTHETQQTTGGTGVVGGIPQWDPETGVYVVVPYEGPHKLYVQIGGHWVPTGTEPFIPPATL